MKRATALGLQGLALVLLVFTATGCDTFDDVFDRDKEAKGTIMAIEGNSLTLDDGFVYIVTDDTEYEGISGLDALEVDMEVEIEYKERGEGTRTALEVELAGAEDDD